MNTTIDLNSPIFAIDTETTGLNSWKGDRPFSISICDCHGRTEYFEWSVSPDRDVFIPEEDIAFIQFIIDSGAELVFHNARFDIRMLMAIGVAFSAEAMSRVHDTYFMAKIVNGQEPDFKLKRLARVKCGFGDEDQKFLYDIVVKLRARARKFGYVLSDSAEADYWLVQQIDNLMPELSPEERLTIRRANEEYCCKDTIRTYLLYRYYRPLIDEDPAFLKFYNFERALLDDIMAMETRGCRIDLDLVAAEITAHKLRMVDTLKFLEKIRPGFNPNSPAQISALLFGNPIKGIDGLGLKPVGEIGKTGQYATDWRSLKSHKQNEAVRAIMQYKSSSKAISTFFEKYRYHAVPDPLNPGGVALHPNINQIQARTTRFSMNDPNLQQVSNSDTNPRDTDPVQARGPFGPRKGYVWYPSDFAQQELRIFADMANVKDMIKAVHEGRDLNTENAQNIWGGEGNRYGIQEMAQCLELGSSEPSTQKVAEAWKILGWNSTLAKDGTYSHVALQKASDWLRSYDWQIVEAQGAVGKKVTRNKSKMTIFTCTYAGGPGAIASVVECPLDEAETNLRLINARYPEMPAFIEASTREARTYGYITNCYGRKIHVERDAPYKGVNYKIQGSATDMMKHAIHRNRVYWNDFRYKGRKLDVHMLLTIHDELIPEIKIGDDYPFVLRTIVQIMEDTEGSTLTVPMEVEMSKVTERWDKKVPVEL